MNQEVPSCPLCKGQRSDLFDQRTFRGIAVRNRICNTCGLVYESPRMSEDEADEFYKSEYRRLYQGGQEGPVLNEIVIQQARAEALFKLFDAKNKQVSRHLDIGCSAGLLLSKFREFYHCDSIGIEPGNAFREYARRQNLKIYSSLEELQHAREGSFDLISMSHVLEHLVDPVAYLVKLRESSLAQGGWLYLEVPNLYAHDSFEIAHLYSFSSHTLRQVLQQAGFEVVRVVKHGHPRSKITPLYLNVLAHPRHTGVILPGIKPERGVRSKRRLGLFVRECAKLTLRVEARLRRMIARSSD